MEDTICPRLQSNDSLLAWVISLITPSHKKINVGCPELKHILLKIFTSLNSLFITRLAERE